MLKLQKQAGWYISGKICGKSVSFLVDSGASCSLIDVSVYEMLKGESAMKLSPVEESVVLADGSNLATLGEADVGLQLGSNEYPMSVVVAELGGKSAILGLDFIEEYDIILRLGRGQILIESETFTLHRENAKKGCCRISVGQTLTVPQRSCQVVEVDVDMGKAVRGRKAPEACAIECLPSLAESTGLILDRGVVHVGKGKVPVNLINVHDEPIQLHKGKTLGTLQPVKSVSKFEPVKERLRRRKSS